MPELFITTDHHGKMEGLVSINTSTTHNEFCKRSPLPVCKKCYAKRLESMRPTLVKRYLTNSDILSKKVLAKKEIPHLNYIYVRLHSYGELINKTHFRNFCKIAAGNPDTTFVLWTKRISLVNLDIKPDNLRLIFSNPVFNTDAPIPEGFSKTFNVYTQKYVKENNIHINCSQSCKQCMICYNNREINTVREILK